MPAHQRFPRRSEEAHLVQGADGLPLESRAQGPLSPNGAHQDRAREEAAPGVGSLAPRVQRPPGNSYGCEDEAAAEGSARRWP